MTVGAHALGQLPLGANESTSSASTAWWTLDLSRAPPVAPNNALTAAASLYVAQPPSGGTASSSIGWFQDLSRPVVATRAVYPTASLYVAKPPTGAPSFGWFQSLSTVPTLPDQVPAFDLTAYAVELPPALVFFGWFQPLSIPPPFTRTPWLSDYQINISVPGPGPFYNATEAALVSYARTASPVEFALTYGTVPL